MWSICSNLINLMIVPSSRTVPLSIVNAAQQKIGTGRELDKDLRPCISDRATNAKKGIKGRTLDGKKSKVVLSMFRDSKKEGALEYADWRAEVEEYIKKGYEDNKIKDAIAVLLGGKGPPEFPAL